jgi:hypothetical protein
MNAILKRRWIFLSCIAALLFVVATLVIGAWFAARKESLAREAATRRELEELRNEVGSQRVMKVELKDLRKQAGATLAESDILAIANDFAKKQGINLSRFEEPHIRYLPRENGQWFVHYPGKAVDGMVIIGDHFSIVVADKTKECELVPGM